jgi:hypothetical protein
MCTGTAFQVQWQGTHIKMSGVSDAIANAPGACMPWRRVKTLKLTVNTDSKNSNFRSNVRGTAFGAQRQGTGFMMTRVSDAIVNAPGVHALVSYMNTQIDSIY